MVQPLALSITTRCPSQNCVGGPGILGCGVCAQEIQREPERGCAFHMHASQPEQWAHDFVLYSCMFDFSTFMCRDSI